MAEKKNPLKLPKASEEALIKVLCDKTQSPVRFKSLCDRNPHLFGSPSSELRRSVQKRRQFLKANPTKLQKALEKLVIHHSKEDSTTPDIIDNPQAAEDDDDIDELSVTSSSTPYPPLPKVNRFPYTPTSSRLAVRATSSMAHLRESKTFAAGVTPTYQLNFQEPWKNPNGMLTVVGHQVEVDNTVMDKLTIMKPIFDMKDYDKKHYKARLTQQGDGIIITEPTIPAYLWENPVEIQELVDDDYVLCEATLRTYKTIRTDMKKHKPQSLTQDITYLFPDSITCNNEFFNKLNRRNSQFELDMEMVVFQQELKEKDHRGHLAIEYLPFVVWKLAIDGPGKQTEDDDEENQGISKAFARLRVRGGTTASSDMRDS